MDWGLILETQGRLVTEGSRLNIGLYFDFNVVRLLLIPVKTHWNNVNLLGLVINVMALRKRF